VVPKLKISPGAWVLVNVTVPQSEAIGGVQLAIAWQDVFAAILISVQPDIIGAVISSTVTSKEQVEVFEPSDAV
jgi:hypothetical protein